MIGTVNSDQVEQSDAVYDLADGIEVVIEANPGRDWSPSEMARKIGATTSDTRGVLQWMDARRDPAVVANGNGAWTRYGSRR